MNDLEFHPATPNRWGDIESLFGANGACGGCWCMSWRRPRAAFNKGKGSENRQMLKDLVDNGPPPGLLAYSGGEVVAWCAVAPRAVLPALERSRLFQPVDDQPVWSISCFYVRKNYRRMGLTAPLAEAAAAFAKSQGASIVEAYPQRPKATLPDVFVWTGLESALTRAGFTEAARRSPNRPVVRKAV